MKNALNNEGWLDKGVFSGVFLIVNEKLVWSHLEREWGDKADVEEIKAVIEMLG